MLIISPPASGKGSQAGRISKRLGVVAVCTGEIFRANVKSHTLIDMEAKKYMDAGDLVPDSITNEMIRTRLTESNVGNGFMLDGYPRTVEQVDYLDQVLAESGQKLDVVLQLTADNHELVVNYACRCPLTRKWPLLPARITPAASAKQHDESSDALPG